MAERSTLARPYARAAFEHALEAGDLGRWSAMLDGVRQVVTDEALAPYVGNPLVPAGQLAEVVLQVAGDAVDGGLDEAAGNYVRLLAENRRLALMPEICSLFGEYRNQEEGVVDVTLRSATELDEGLKDRYAAALGRRFGKEVRLSCQVDESLLGGAVIKAGDTVIDGSVRARLAALATSLTR